MQSGLRKWAITAAFIAVFLIAHFVELVALVLSAPTMIVRRANRLTFRLLDFLSR